ncbi:hypothetical protein H4R34_000487 [Dimargaris verticillata]|uniref:Uncharacterized protein n=1 Tax=Dimargaris verticillata TaxID=2761393 RepID=A0A9W8BD82_9FUNG|nr:hypothetical protein H4R34_000487 [Dimargaris verticillata]
MACPMGHTAKPSQGHRAVCPFTMDELRLFHEFSKHDWDNDNAFQLGLAKVLESSSSSPTNETTRHTTAANKSPAQTLPPAQQLALQLWYYRRLGKPIDQDKYHLFQTVARQTPAVPSLPTAAPASGAKESPFVQFKQYDFASDTAFQQGLAQIMAKWQEAGKWLNSRDLDTHILKFKLYYYAKHVEPIDVKAYLQWKRQHEEVNNGPKCPFAHMWKKEKNVTCDQSIDTVLAQLNKGPIRTLALTDNECQKPWTIPTVTHLLQSLPAPCQLPDDGGRDALAYLLTRATPIAHRHPITKSQGPPSYQDEHWCLPGLAFEPLTAQCVEAEPFDQPLANRVTKVDLAASLAQTHRSLVWHGLYWTRQAAHLSHQQPWVYLLDGGCHRSMLDLVSGQGYVAGTEHLGLTVSPFADSGLPWLPAAGLYTLAQLQKATPAPEAALDSASGRVQSPPVRPIGHFPGLAYVLLFSPSLRLRCPDLLHLGLIHNFIPSAEISEVQQKIAVVVGASSPDDMAAALHYVCESARAHPGPSRLRGRLPAIAQHLAKAHTVDELMTGLAEIPAPWANECCQVLQTHSPLLVHVLVEALNRAQALTCHQCHRLEYYIATKFTQMPDFATYLYQLRHNFQADNNAKDRKDVVWGPWQHDSCQAVTVTDVASFFAEFDPSAEPLVAIASNSTPTEPGSFTSASETSGSDTISPPRQSDIPSKSSKALQCPYLAAQHNDQASHVETSGMAERPSPLPAQCPFAKKIGA